MTAHSFSLGLQTGQGYDAYDLVRCQTLPDRPRSDDFQWDLGEFDQKGTVATRWGAKGELVNAIAVAKQCGIDVIIDAVLNVCRTHSPVVPSHTEPSHSIKSVPTRRRNSWRPQWIP